MIRRGIIFVKRNRKRELQSRRVITVGGNHSLKKILCFTTALPQLSGLLLDEKVYMLK